jgi:hypothetical protein
MPEDHLVGGRQDAVPAMALIAFLDLCEAAFTGEPARPALCNIARAQTPEIAHQGL